MAVDVLIYNFGTSNFAHPQMPSIGPGESYVIDQLKQVNADDYSGSYDDLAAIGVAIAEDGTFRPGASLYIGTDTIADNLNTVVAFSSGANYTLTLPVAATVGQGHELYIGFSGTAATVTIDGAGAETIDGSADTTISSEGEVLRIVSDGVSNWDLL